MDTTVDKPGVFNDPRYKELAHNLIILKEDLVYRWEINGVENRLTVPVGTISDGASIPVWATFVTAILPGFETIYPYGVHLFATFVHDIIWKYRGQLPVGMHQYFNKQTQKWEDAAYNKEGHPIWTFKTSNKLLARHLRELKVGKKERRAMFLAVSSPIGWWNWRTGKLPNDARPKKLKIA